MLKRIRWTALGLLLSTSAFAENLRDRALTEIQQPGKYQPTSTSATVAGDTGMLSLKDPMPAARGRSWNYFLRLAVQSFEPSGRVGNDLTSTRFNLAKTSVAPMPVLTVGVRNSLIKRDSWNLDWGLGARVAYTSTKGSSCFDTGFCESQSQLNSLLLGGTPELVLSFARLSQWSFSLGAEIGTINYTQTSGNNLAAFSAQASYAGGTAGAEFKFGKYWSALAAYTHREITEKSNIGIQADNYEVGTRLMW